MDALGKEQYQKNEEWAAICEAHGDMWGKLELNTKRKFQKSNKFFLTVDDLISFSIGNYASV